MSKYSQTDVEALLQKMATERASLLAAAERMTAQEALFVPADAEGEEQWMATEQLAHLWEMERSYIAWCRAALAESGVSLTGVSGEPVAIPIEDAPQHEVAELVAVLREERGETVAFIESLSLEQFERTAVSPAFGELTVMQWLRSFYRHDRQHCAQIERRQSDYQPKFVNGREPNQRQMRIDAVAARRTTTADAPTIQTND